MNSASSAKRQSMWTLMKFLMLLTAFALALLHAPCVAKRSAQDWSKINFDELEKQWEDGDDEEDLKTESQLEFERLERRRKLESVSAGSLDPSALNEMDPAQIGALAAGQKDATGPTMMFAKVGSRIGEEGQHEGGGTTLTKEDTDEVAGRLQQLAFLGGLELSVYAIDPGSVLVSTQRGWEGKKILDFLLSRSEVTKVTWNSKDFLPPADDDEL